MSDINYEGYGIDFSYVLDGMPDGISLAVEMAIDNNDMRVEFIPNSPDLSCVSPTNTDSFYFLFYIPTCYRVAGHDGQIPRPRMFSKDEADLLIRDNINEFLNALVDVETDAIDEETLAYAKTAVEPAIREHAKFDYEQDRSWSDCI